jgi:hypothetical protein
MKHIAMKVHINPDCHTVIAVLDIEAGVDDPGHHHQTTTNSPRHGGTKSHGKAYDYEDDEKEMGAPCFTRRVRSTPIPKGFKLPHDHQKYDGSQEPHSWLLDYLQAVKNTRGIERDSNAKFTAPSHRRGTVMVRQAGNKNNWKLGRTHKAVHKQL